MKLCFPVKTRFDLPICVPTCLKLTELPRPLKILVKLWIRQNLGAKLVKNKFRSLRMFEFFPDGNTRN